MKLAFNEKTQTVKKAPAYTQKGALAVAPEDFGNAVENFFVTAEKTLPILKGKNSEQILKEPSLTQELRNSFNFAYRENPIAALRLLFYFRDPRNGQGRKSIFHVLMNEVAQDKDILEKLLSFIPKYGSWRDLNYLLLSNSNVSQIVLNFWLNQINEDSFSADRNQSVSLAAKYFPTPNKGRLAREIFYTCFGRFNRNRQRNIALMQTISRLKKRIQLVEQKMTSGKWEEIEYSKVPAKAFKNYTKAFTAHDAKRFTEFLNDVLDQKDGAEIKTSGLNPVEILNSLLKGETNEKSAQALWEQLSSAFELKKNILVLADTSGSMYTASRELKYSPATICNALAIFFAELLPVSSPFYRSFLTFETQPHLVTFTDKDRSLLAKYNKLKYASWNGSTNVNAAFELILNAAILGKSSQHDLPEVILIISDMQFDGSVKKTNFNQWKEKFEKSGYKLPQICFWNVGIETKNNPVTVLEDGTTIITGQSPNALKVVLGAEIKNTRELILDILNKYSDIVL